MIYYCTLFDSNYLSRGIALYESLKIHSDSFHLYIVAFDNDAADVLTKLNLEYVTVITLSDFEDEDLLAVKPTRTKGEYCWTCTPSIILYCIEKYRLDMCTYLDSDLYFFQDPAVLVEEMKDNSVLLTLHRYTPKYDASVTSGLYCVQFMTFKNTPDGMTALRWWRAACIEWCYFRMEDGKFGDQKYLDDWPTRFKGVHVLNHIGGGVAPWNVQRYEIDILDKQLMIIEKATNRKEPLVFYHFHGLKFCDHRKVFFNDYELSNEVIKKIYFPYVDHLEKIKVNLHDKITFNPHGKNIADPLPLKRIIFWWIKDVLLGIKHFIDSIFFVSTKKRIRHANVYSVKKVQNKIKVDKERLLA